MCAVPTTIEINWTVNLNSMSKISLKFTNKDGKFCLCALIKGTQVRHYKVVNVLKNPNFSKWNARAQMFISKAESDLQNNIILLDFLAPFEKLLEEHEFESGKDLFAMYDLGEKERAEQAIIAEKKELTLGEFLQQVIDELKNPTKHKPSANFMTYQTLFNKLTKEKKVINTPISKVNRNTFVHFSDFILKQKGLKGSGNNYISMMKLLTATINRARKSGLTEYVPNFSYMEHAPVINKLSENAADMNRRGGTVKSLSPEQYEQFLTLDLNTIQLHKAHLNFYKELYRDFCILLYEMKSRPIDIMKLTWENIAYNKQYNRWTCTYIPSKKKNYSFMRENDANPLVVQFLTPRALEIIMKYKDQSQAGYILPFAHNKKKWDLNDPEQYHSYYTQQNRAQGRINRFLWKVGQYFGLPYHLTIYAFRRTAITKAIIDNDMPIAMLAKVAGTSVGMIEHHYTNFLDALAAY